MTANSTQPNSKRDEIVVIASRLFYEQGFGATGIKQIIDEAGIAKGTFYSHFQSKEALGMAWLKARHHIWNGWLEKVISSHDTAGHQLLATFDFLAAWLKDSDYRGCAFINTMAETPNFENPMREEVAAHKRELHERFQELAITHFQKPAGSEDEACHIGTTIFLLFEGALVEAQNFRKPWPIDTARAAAISLLRL